MFVSIVRIVKRNTENILHRKVYLDWSKNLVKQKMVYVIDQKISTLEV